MKKSLAIAAIVLGVFLGYKLAQPSPPPLVLDYAQKVCSTDARYEKGCWIPVLPRPN